MIVKMVKQLSLMKLQFISKDYISKYTMRAEKEIAVSNDIIVHDLIKKTKESDEVIKGGQK